MERDDRSPVGTFFVDAPLSPNGTATLGEAAAHHARVKRLAAGNVVCLTDGVGHIATGTISEIRRASIVVATESVRSAERPASIHVRAPVADRERMLWLAEKATELGVASWQAIRFRRSASVSPRGEGSAFHAKVRARMISALEQSGGAWLPELMSDTTVDALSVTPGAMCVALDAGGDPLASLLASASVATEAVVLVGPEGGIEPSELSALVDAGWRTARLANTILRFETAGVAAIAVVRAARLQRGRDDGT